MTEPTTTRTPSEQHTAWRSYAGRRVTVHAPHGSYAAGRAESVLRQAERVVAVFDRLLEHDSRRTEDRFDVYLTDPAGPAGASSDGPAPPDDAIVRVIQPDSPTVPLADAVVRLLVGRWCGAAAMSAERIVAGIAGVVAARTGEGPTVVAADEGVRSALADGQTVSIFPLDGLATDALGRAIATSFVAWLVEGYGGGALRQYLGAFDPVRDDAAAAVAFHQPLGALEERWLETVRRRPRGGTAFKTLAGDLLPLLRPYRRRTLELLALIVLGVGISVAVPLTIMWIVDHVVAHAHGHYEDLVLFVGLLLVLFIANALVSARRTYLHAWLTEQVTSTLQGRLFGHLQRLSHNFYAHAKTSDLMAALTTDLREIQAAMTLVVGSGLYQLLLAAATAVTLLILDLTLGLLVLIVVPVFAAGYMTLRSRWQREARGYGRVQAEAEHVAHEQFAAHDEIVAFGREEQAIGRYHERHVAMTLRHLRLVRLSAMFESTLHLASGLGHVVVFGYGGYQVISESGTTLGVLFAFAHLLPLFYEPIERLADVGHTVEGAAGAFDRIDELLAEPITITDKPDAVALPDLADAISLDRVTFGYGGGRPTLHDLSLSIPAGAEVAIVGPSGSGKSTIVNLLMRFWDPDAGGVHFDGRDLRDVTLDSLRGQIGLVSQDTFIFNTSVRENIAVGRPDATDAAIEAAAKAAQLDAFVAALPAGYHTVLGERGVRMSGGQRQRLAIARALLRDPCVLILDEATSSLDPRTETEIQETLAAVARGRTVIAITHRLPAVVTADHIFVLDDGRLVEEGHHAALVKAGGLYQRLYEEQMHYLHGGGVLRVGIEVPRLRRIPLFADLDAAALDAVAAQFMLERYAAEENVVRQGDPGDKLYAISRGQLDVLIGEDVDGTDGHRPRRVNTLRAGDYFGEMALLTGEPRNATVRTTMPTQLYSLASTDFAGLMERIPAVREAVARTVERRRAENAAVAATSAAKSGA